MRVRIIISLLASLLPGAVFAADERHALVIGNAAYEEVHKLSNPTRDAQDMARKLTEIGFKVSMRLDLDKTAMNRAVADFYRSIGDLDAMTLLFYAGHAMQLRGHNYLIPITAKLERQADLPRNTLTLQYVFDHMRKAGTRQNVVVLDACRDNPYKERRNGGLGTLAGGLAPVEAPPGTLIAYATEPGSYAADGTGRNGTYTKHILRHIAEQLPIETVFKRVRQGVARETDGDQIPWEHSSLFGPLFINPRPNRSIPQFHRF